MIGYLHCWVKDKDEESEDHEDDKEDKDDDEEFFKLPPG